MYLLRLLKLGAGALLARGRESLLGPSKLRMRVWPNDLDLNLHVNNGRYLTLMDLGRFHLMARGGVLGPALRLGWRPVVGAATIRFRASLAPFMPYVLRTQILCWDEKWFYMEQRFLRGHRAVAVGLVQGLLRGPEGNVPTAAVLASVGEQAVSPPMPAHVRKWLEAEELAGGNPLGANGPRPSLPGAAAALLACALVSACATTGGLPPPGPGVDLARVELLCSTAERARRGTLEVRALLDSTDPAARGRAALAAGRAADREAAPALARLLADPEVGATAAWALGRIEGGEAPLVACLASSCGGAAASARALGHGRRSPAALEALSRALVGGAPAAAAAAFALGVNARTAGKGADEAVAASSSDALLRALARPEPEVRAGAAYALGRLPRLAAAQQRPLEAGLKGALAAADAETRALAARAWGKQGLPATGLAAALADPDWRVRVEAARGLPTAQGGADAVAAWLPAAVRTAGAEGPPAAARWAHPLVALLEAATQAKVRPAALPAPQNLSAATPAATAAVRCAAALARDRQAAALAETPACAAGLEPGWRGRARAGALAAELLEAAPVEKRAALLEAALAALADPDGRVRARAAAAAGPSLAARLIELLADPDPFVAGSAAGQLAEDPASARAAGPAAAAALARLAPAHARAAGDAEADALGAMAALLAAAAPAPGAGAASESASESASASASASESASASASASESASASASASESASASASASASESASASASASASEPPPRPGRSPLLPLLVTPNLPLHRALTDALSKLSPGVVATPAPPPSIPHDARAAPAPTRLRVQTTAGDLVLRLRTAPSEAPLTAAAIGALARRKVYDGLPFHRVVPDFVIQGGDPRGDGDGGPGWAIADEHTPLFFRRGTLGIATSGPDTGGSQLFICHAAQPHLDGRYTIVGELEAGEEVLDAIQVGDEIRAALAE